MLQTVSEFRRPRSAAAVKERSPPRAQRCRTPKSAGLAKRRLGYGCDAQILEECLTLRAVQNYGMPERFALRRTL
jgi:hypothetical protein